MSIFICGITGTQGSSIATHLLTSPSPPAIHGITRDASSPTAQKLTSLGAVITPGSYSDTAALTAALKPCKALFLNISPSFTDAAAELATARQIIHLAKANGVEQLIYSSALSVNNPQSLPHWDPESFIASMLLSKKAIEGDVRAAGFKSYTILRPGTFMSNFVEPLVRMYNGLVDQGRWRTAMQRDTIMPLVDPDTIGRFGAAAFMDPERFDKQEIQLADEFSTVDQVLGKLGRATGRDLQAVYMTDDEINEEKGSDPFLAAALMIRGLAGYVDLERVKEWGMPVSSMDNFITREMARVTDTYKQGEGVDQN